MFACHQHLFTRDHAFDAFAPLGHHYSFTRATPQFCSLLCHLLHLVFVSSKNCLPGILFLQYKHNYSELLHFLFVQKAVVNGSVQALHTLICYDYIGTVLKPHSTNRAPPKSDVGTLHFKVTDIIPFKTLIALKDFTMQVNCYTWL